MRKAENLSVKVTYEVGLGDVEMPEEVFKELTEAAENLHTIDCVGYDKRYCKAANWLNQNIKEADCNSWEAEIEEIN